jgi:hypothetical protein
MLFLTAELPLLSNELEWMLIGQKLNEGLYLYNEILTQVAPLSSYFYQLIVAFFGTNQIVLEIIAGGIVYIQILLFNFMVNKRNLLNEKTYVPALLYLVLMSISFDLMKLSPSLLANTFVIMGVNSVLSQIEKRDGLSDDIFESGLLFGIATLFHHPAFVFILWALLVLFLYTGINIRQAFMVVLAFLLPLLFMYLFFYFNGKESDFANIWLFNFNSFIRLTLLNIRDILIVYTLPVVLSLFGIIKVLRGHRYNSFQNRSHQSLLILGVFAFIAFLLSGKYLPSNLIYFIIPLGFYCAGFFIHSKKVFLPEMIFLFSFGLIVFMAFIGAKNSLGFSTNLLSEYRIDGSKAKLNYNGKRIFITGRNIDAYYSNYMATGYLSWNLARKDFENPNNYLSISNIYNNFTKDMPEVIIDDEEVMPKVFENIPDLAKKYKMTGTNVFELIEKQ